MGVPEPEDEKSNSLSNFHMFPYSGRNAFSSLDLIIAGRGYGSVCLCMCKQVCVCACVELCVCVL